MGPWGNLLSRTLIPAQGPVLSSLACSAGHQCPTHPASPFPSGLPSGAGAPLPAPSGHPPWLSVQLPPAGLSPPAALQPPSPLRWLLKPPAPLQAPVCRLSQAEWGLHAHQERNCSFKCKLGFHRCTEASNGAMPYPRGPAQPGTQPLRPAVPSNPNGPGAGPEPSAPTPTPRHLCPCPTAAKAQRSPWERPPGPLGHWGIPHSLWGTVIPQRVSQPPPKELSMQLFPLGETHMVSSQLDGPANQLCSPLPYVLVP